MADKKDAPSEGSPDDIMSPADLKPILARAKRGKEASCVICLTKKKEGVILLDKRRKPKQLVGELKKQAAAAGLKLEMASIRWGKASVDLEEDPGTVNFKVNKQASASTRPKLLGLIKQAGFQKIEIGVE